MPEERRGGRTDAEKCHMKEGQEEHGDTYVARVDLDVLRSCLLGPLARRRRTALSEAGLDEEPSAQRNRKCAVEEAFVRQTEDDKRRSEREEEDEEALEEGLAAGTTVQGWNGRGENWARQASQELERKAGIGVN